MDEPTLAFPFPAANFRDLIFGKAGSPALLVVMSIENEFNLESLFQPAWAKEAPNPNRFARYTGDEGAERPRRGGDRPFSRGPGGPAGFGGGAGGGNRGPRSDGPRPPRRDGPPGGGPGSGPRGDRPGFQRHDGGRPGDQAERHEAPPQVELNIQIIPEENGIESLSRQIKLTGRAYPLFDIAQLIVQKPERYSFKIESRKKPDGTLAQPMFRCALDDSLWLNEAEAVNHVLTKHLATFYQIEKTPTDPPKGVYKLVAQCGVSGVVLGPPNYHDYQNQLRKLHTERFSRMPFDMFKSRVKMVTDEVVVKKWIEDQSFKTEFVALNLPEAVRLASLEEVQQHFRETHQANLITQIDSVTITGVAGRDVRQPLLARVLRFTWEDQRRFPLQLVNVLSGQLASRGLQFFKVNKTVTHVAVARPHFLDLEANPVSTSIKKIIEFINATPRCNRKQLVETLAPAPAAAPVAAPAPAVEGQPTPAAPAPVEMTAEQSSLNADLHWLIHQGHVIEFHNGILETAKKPLPKPQPAPRKRIEPRPAPSAPAEAAVPAAESAPAATAEAAPVAEAKAPPVEAAPNPEEKPASPQA